MTKEDKRGLMVALICLGVVVVVMCASTVIVILDKQYVMLIGSGLFFVLLVVSVAERGAELIRDRKLSKKEQQSRSQQK